MPMQVWIYSALVASSFIVLWWALTGERTVSDQAVRNLGSKRSSDLRVIKLNQPPVERIALPLLRSVGRKTRRFTPAGWLDRYEKNLGEAGRLGRWNPEQIVGAKFLLAILFGFYFGLQIAAEPTSGKVALTAAAVAFAFFLPDLLLSSIASRRKEAIELELPDSLDQLTMSVEAGLGFEAALSRIADKEDTELAGEFSRLIQDVKLGTPRAEALAALGRRSGVEDLRHVVLALRQAEKLGVPLAQTLRTQADEMRTKRAFRAEEKAHKLPVKMIFPLGMCILPALFIVLLGPAVIQITRIF